MNESLLWCQFGKFFCIKRSTANLQHLEIGGKGQGRVSEWNNNKRLLRLFFGQTMWTILIMGTMQTFCTSLALSLYFIFTSVSFHSGNWCFFSTDYFRDLKADCMVASEVKAIIRTNICSKPFLLPFCFHTSLLVLAWDLNYFALAYIFNLFQLNGFERQTHMFCPRLY